MCPRARGQRRAGRCGPGGGDPCRGSAASAEGQLDGAAAGGAALRREGAVEARGAGRGAGGRYPRRRCVTDRRRPERRSRRPRGRSGGARAARRKQAAWACAVRCEHVGPDSGTGAWGKRGHGDGEAWRGGQRRISRRRVRRAPAGRGRRARRRLRRRRLAASGAGATSPGGASRRGTARRRCGLPRRRPAGVGREQRRHRIHRRVQGRVLPGGDRRRLQGGMRRGRRRLDRSCTRGGRRNRRARRRRRSRPLPRRLGVLGGGGWAGDRRAASLLLRVRPAESGSQLHRARRRRAA
mmetsp:Transcript_39818/g.128907  ORF Transcript_39818/g.128907 Transcript_39818/m.128907 type:complete len:296 (+) Transcript_39818:761-1648(+)